MTKKIHAELKKKEGVALKKELEESSVEIMKLRAQLRTGGATKEVGKLHNLKKKIARIKTLEKERGGL